MPLGAVAMDLDCAGEIWGFPRGFPFVLAIIGEWGRSRRFPVIFLDDLDVWAISRMWSRSRRSPVVFLGDLDVWFISGTWSRSRRSPVLFLVDLDVLGRFGSSGKSLWDFLWDSPRLEIPLVDSLGANNIWAWLAVWGSEAMAGESSLDPPSLLALSFIVGLHLE